MLRDDAVLYDIIESARLACSYVHDSSREAFLYDVQDVQLQDAVIRRIEVIGEAVRSLSEETKSLFPDLPWQDMADMRNFLIHQYGDVDPSIVWDTVELDLPLLINQLERVVDIG